MPASPRAEGEVIGAVLMTPQIWPDVAARLRPQHFAVERHRVLFEAFQSIDAGGQRIDIPTLREHLSRAGKWDLIGGAQTVGAIVDRFGTTTNVAHFCGIVRDEYRRRQVICAAREAERLARQQDLDLDDMAERVDALMVEATAAYEQDSHLGLMGDGIDRTLRRISDAGESGVPIGASTGFQSVDDHTGGMGPDELWVLAGQTGMGKTSFAMAVATNFALRGDHVLYFTVEMLREPRLQQRMLAARARIQVPDMKRGRLDGMQWSRLNEAAEWVRQLPIHVDDSASLSLDRVRSVSRYLSRQHRISLVVIDYLQLMVARVTAKKSRNDALGEITRGCKVLAQDILHCPVMLLSQLNRSMEYENRKNSFKRKPRCSDLRDSGNIEQDADAVAFIVERSVKGCPKNAELWFDKLRDGARQCGIPLNWVPEFYRFEE
jgi:replicative DNA helicase